jgi:hypothetical protein
VVSIPLPSSLSPPLPSPPLSFYISSSLHCHMYSHVCYYLSSLAILATSAASLPVTPTDDDSLPSHLSSPAEVVTAAPPHTRHSPHSPQHSHTHAYSFPYPHNTTHLATHSFLNPPAAEPTAGLTSPHDWPHSHPPSSQAHKGLTVIIFASIGGVIVLLFLALCARRAIVYCRTPRHNAVLTVAERAQLVREIAEYTESASRRQRHSLIGPPPPPYEHAPSYDSLTPHGSL